MQVKDLDGNTTYWTLKGGISHGHVNNKSELHLLAREIIHRCYPTAQVLEEVPVSIRRSETLYLDFYLPLFKKCIEVHGRQHYEFVRFYHQNALGFIKHQKRDRDKKEWCLINEINFLELPYDLTDRWETIISNGK